MREGKGTMKNFQKKNTKFRMTDFSSTFYFLLLLEIGLFIGVQSDCSVHPTGIAPAEKVEVSPNKLLVYHCGSSLFGSGNSAIVSRCINDAWTEVSGVCDDTKTLTKCDLPYTPPTHAEVDTTVTTDDHFRAVKCVDGKQWLSGVETQISRCNDGEWETILDICDDGCPVPRDCHDVAELGLTEDASYYVIASGEKDGTITEVNCALADAPDSNGGRWTMIFGNTVGNSMSETADQYKKGFSVDDKIYFEGLEFLADISKPTADRPEIGSVLEIIFYQADTVAYFATYSNFTVGPAPGYHLESVGTYHGNAGDAMCPHMNEDFTLSATGSDPGPFWWGSASTDGSFACGQGGNNLSANAGWVPLKGQSYDRVEMRIRPIAYDTSNFCPPLTGVETTWTHTELSVPLSRMAGAEITWTCKGFLFYEGVEGGDRTRSGSLGCQEGTPPTWNGTLNLPCTLKCPEGFLKSDDGLKCHMYSSDEAEGFVQASQKCLNAKPPSTLATIVSPMDLKAAITGTYYYVNHAKRAFLQADVMAPFNATIPSGGCAEETCDTSTPQACVVVTDTMYKVSDCKTPFNYICELPGKCPAGFEPTKGGCLSSHITTSPVTLTAAYETCLQNGAGLAHPTSSQQLSHIAQFLRVNLTAVPPDFLIGNNNQDGTWTVGGTYTIEAAFEDELASAADASLYKYRALTVESDTTSLKAIDFPDATINNFVCQYPGPVECVEGPPMPLENMIRDLTKNSSFVQPNYLIDYTCDRGYFVGGDITLVNQTVSCIGMLGGLSPVLARCVRVPVCENATVIFSDSITNTTDENTYYLDGVAAYNCPAGMGFPDLNTTFNATCKEVQDGVFGFSPQTIEDCSYCLEEVALENAESSWLNTSTFQVDSTVTLTCSEGYEYQYNENEQTVTCTSTGWNLTEVKSCYRVCSGGIHLYEKNITNNTVGFVIEETCPLAMYLQPTEEYPTPVSTTKIECTDTGEWVAERANHTFDCYRLCLIEPPVKPANCNSSWNQVDRIVDDEITYTCDPNYYFGNFSQTWVVTCMNDTKWGPLNETMFVCQKACMDEPAQTVGNAELMTETPLWVGEELEYMCPNGTANKDGNTTFKIACQDTGYQTAPADFMCEDACYEPPPSLPELATYNFTGDIREGVTVMYECEGTFAQHFVTTLYTTCTNHTWTGDVITSCLPVEPPGTPAPRPESPYENDEHYMYTADYSIQSIGVNFTSINGIENDYEKVPGPFGFDQAVSLSSERRQCLRKKYYVPNTDRCLINPMMCPDGLSFSIWHKPLFYNNTLEVADTTDDPARYQYIMSTGGDDKGHTGIAIWQQEYWLYGLVTGLGRTWKVRVLGHVSPNNWNNIGITWKNQSTEGLRLFVNGSVQASTTQYETVPNLLGLDPPEIMIGCHRVRSAPSTYGGFIDAEIDEIGMWKRELGDSEIKFFAGGYVDSFENMTSEQMAAKILHIDKTDPIQRGQAMEIMAILSMANSEPTSATLTSSTAGSPTDGTDINPSAASHVDAASVANLRHLITIFNSLVDTTEMPSQYSKEELKKSGKLLDTLNNILSDENTPTLRKIQKADPKEGVMQIIQSYSDYSRELLKATIYPNGSTPYCFKHNLENLVDEMCKYPLHELRRIDPWVHRPSRYAHERDDDRGNTVDKVSVNVQIFPDERCLDRPTNVHSVVYFTAGQASRVRVNSKVMNKAARYEIDSNIVRFEVFADLGRDEEDRVDTSQQLCEPDYSLMDIHPVRIILLHLTQRPAIRKLLFHEGELMTDIAVRRCVWWNPSIEEGGAWDSTGCSIIHTVKERTKCTCNRFGTFAVLAEKVEPHVVPEDPGWLPTIKYICYGISALALIIYIVVVAISGDLKDQFHLSGLNLAVSILIGSVAIIFSDFEKIREDRHLCVAIGGLIQMFYGAVGTWMVALGHCSFKAIISGVVSGKLRAYMGVSWGLALALCGIPFAIALHDLGTDPRCFIAWKESIKEIFFFPQVVFSIAAVFFAIIIFCNIKTPALRKENIREDYCSFSLGAAILLIYLSFTWTIGLLAYIDFGTGVNFYSYFHILNSLSGLVLLLCIGLGSKRFRGFVAGQTKKRREKLQDIYDKNKDTNLKRDPPLVPDSKFKKPKKNKK